jgi:hypothetical protein
MRCKTRCADDALAAARDEIDRQMPSAPITNQESRQLDGSIRRERERACIVTNFRAASVVQSRGLCLDRAGDKPSCAMLGCSGLARFV